MNKEVKTSRTPPKRTYPQWADNYWISVPAFALSTAILCGSLVFPLTQWGDRIPGYEYCIGPSGGQRIDK